MNERRIDPRKLLNTRVRLYHPEFGRLEGETHDICDGGVAVLLSRIPGGMMEPTETPLYFRTLNTDVLFPVSCLRQIKNGVVLKFLE